MKQEDRDFRAQFVEQSVRINHAVESKLSCCSGLSIKWILYICFINFITGLGLLAFVLVLSAEQGDVVEALDEAGLIGAAVASGFLSLTSILGFFAVKKRSKFAMIVLSVVLIFIGGLFTFIVDGIDEINAQDANNNDNLNERVETRINDFIIAAFNTCCADEFGLDRIGSCGDALALDPESTDVCFFFASTYDDALDRIENTNVCNALENAQVNGNSLVGAQEDGACGGLVDSEAQFVSDFGAFLEAIILPIGVVFIILGILVFLNVVASCVLLCANQGSYFDDFGMQGKQKKESIDRLI
eukprot:snap_masked-scaffold_9-processed-gene-7.51-mRNA-1 protein AED:1.00 eAED:1.00 QI:0/0/0/0/1/1/2/0/300